MFQKLGKVLYLLVFLVALIQAVEDDQGVYKACQFFSTDHIEFIQVRSAEQDIAYYEAVYKEQEHRRPWFTRVPFYDDIHKPGSLDQKYIDYLERGGKSPIYTTDHEQIKSRDKTFFKTREQLGCYKLSSSFSDYLLYLKGTDTLIGRFIFRDRTQSCRLETGIDILEDFRHKSFGAEVIQGMIENVIKPGIGYPFSLAFCKIDSMNNMKIGTIQYAKFAGVFAKIDPWWNYPSISVHCKGGYSLYGDYSSLSAFYPSQKGEEGMSERDLESFKPMMRIIYRDISEQKGESFSQFLIWLRTNSQESFTAVQGYLKILAESRDLPTARAANRVLGSLIDSDDESSDGE